MIFDLFFFFFLKKLFNSIQKRRLIVEGNCFDESDSLASFNCNDAPHLIAFEDIHGGPTTISVAAVQSALAASENTDADSETKLILRGAVTDSSAEQQVLFHVSQCSNIELHRLGEVEAVGKRKALQKGLRSKFEYEIKWRN